jgi:hypothetical protein
VKDKRVVVVVVVVLLVEQRPHYPKEEIARYKLP